MDRKLLKTVQTITTFRNRLADPVGTRRGPPLVRGPQFENRWFTLLTVYLYFVLFYLAAFKRHDALRLAIAPEFFYCSYVCLCVFSGLLK